MFYTNLNIFGILSFEPNSYQKIINSIKESRAYVSYVDSSKEKGIINRRYEKYVMLKQAAYTVNAPNRNKDPKINKIYTTLMHPSITHEQISNFIKEHGMHDDFEYDYSIQHKDQHSYVATHKIIPIEHSVFDSALDLDNNFEQINRQFLSEDFLLKNHQRFFLIPFLGKYEGNFVKPIVVANVYDVGIITIQISIAASKQKIEISSTEPNSIQLNDVEFYQAKENYSSRDFWNRDKVGNITMYQILDYYSKLLKLICKKQELQTQPQKQIAWVFGDFEPNKRSEHQDFVDKYKGLYVSHLSNAPKKVIEKMTGAYLDDYLDKAKIQKYKTMHFYCSEVISLLSFSYSAFHADAVSQLKEDEKELKKEGLYNQVLGELYKEYSLFSMFEFLRFYELTFIKRFYALKLLNKLSSNSIKSLKDYNSIRNQFNSLKINYDQQLLFKSYGSPMELYGSLLEKSGTDKIVEKVEKLFTNAREDVNSSREFSIKQSETYILIMTSILTVLLGYRGIKYLVEDLLVNLPFNIGTFFSLHPLRWTVSLWVVLVVCMALLNIFRYRAIKK
jgi:hypothetical protein